MLKTKIEYGRAPKISTSFAATYHRLLRKAKMEDISSGLKGLMAAQNLCDEQCACGSVLLHTIPREGHFPSLLEREHVLWKRSSQKEGSSKHQCPAVGSEGHRRDGFFSQYRVRKKLLGEAPSDHKNALEDRKSDRGSRSGHKKCLMCCTRVHRIGMLPNRLLNISVYNSREALPHAVRLRSEGCSPSF